VLSNRWVIVIGSVYYFLKPFAFFLLNKSFGIKIIWGKDKSRQVQHKNAIINIAWKQGRTDSDQSLSKRLEINNQTTLQKIY